MDLRLLLLTALIGAIHLMGHAQASPRTSDEIETVVEPLELRQRTAKINIEIDPNDIENNEIEGSTKKKPVKPEEEKKEEESNDWFSFILKFFGYKSFGELLKNVDIFSIPQAIQNATRTYKEEIGVVQCYAEFTTFAVFSQEDSAFYNYSLFRNKRDASGQLVEENRATSDKSGQATMISNIAETIISMLQRSPATAKYGTTIKQLLPHVMNMLSHDNPQQAMMQFATTNLLPLISSFASGSSQSNKVTEKITYQRPTPSYQHQSPAGAQNSVQPTSSSSSGTSPLLSLVSQFLLGGNRKTTPAKRPSTPGKKPQAITQAQKKVDKKTSFIQTIINFIRPLFISIVGSAPGDNGVQTIRDVSRRDTLSRVDDALIDEVTSPFFCAKNYLINKAWSLTENGVKYVVGYIDTAQQERMFRMLTDDAPIYQNDEFYL